MVLPWYDLNDWCIVRILLLTSCPILMYVQFSSLRSCLVWRCKRTVCQSAVSLFLGCFKQNALSLEVVQLLRKPPSLPWTSLIFPMSFCLYLCPSISASLPQPLSVWINGLNEMLFFFFFPYRGKDVYLFLEACVSPEDVQLGSSWARSINSIDSWVTASRRVCRRRRALAHRKDLCISFSCWYFISGMLRGRGHMMM